MAGGDRRWQLRNRAAAGAPEGAWIVILLIPCLVYVFTQTKKHYDTVVLPTMSTGASDMAQIRSKGIQCYGIGPALDTEDGPKGFGAHSDQERILESELHRFVRFQSDVVIALAGAK